MALIPIDRFGPRRKKKTHDMKSTQEIGTAQLVPFSVSLSLKQTELITEL
jgi:hypothetical protein